MKSKHFGAKVFTCLSVLVCLFLIACKVSVNSQEKYYTITYQTEHGTAPESKKVLSGTVLKSEDLPAITADGFSFGGWYVGSSLITPELNYAVSSDITLTAKWTTETPAPTVEYFTISYQSDYGTTPQSKSVASGTVLTAADLPTLEARGYTFDGWYLGFYKVEPGYTVESNINLIAGWTVKQLVVPDGYYAITYESDYGEAPETKVIQYKTELTYEDLPDLSDANHEFNGWYFYSTKILPGYKVYTDMPLVAYWDDEKPAEVNYTVSYYSQFGGTLRSREFTAGDVLLGGDLLTMREDNYDFDGWYFGDIKMEANYPVIQNMTLVARWTPQNITSMNVLVGIATNATQSEMDFKLTATKVGSNYTITATSGFDYYFWFVDDPEENSNLLYASEIFNSSGEAPQVVLSNTLHFNESLLPSAVIQDGTYLVYCQAIKKLYNSNGQPSGFERAGLEFVVVKM